MANLLETTYTTYSKTPSTINEHFPLLRKYASECSHITEFGTGIPNSTYAMFAGYPSKMISYDIQYVPEVEEVYKIAQEAGIYFLYNCIDILKTEIEETDLLFIDTLHNYSQLSQELSLHGNKAKKYIIFHDTTSFGDKDELGDGPGLWKAIEEFIVSNPEWKLKERLTNNNGLTILERNGKDIPKISIVIPTCNRFEDALRPCIEKIIEYTDLSDKEIIVVCNGSDEISRTWAKEKGCKVIWFDFPIGYIRAINAGIKEAKGEYVLLLDDDTHLLPQYKNQWIDILMEPFKDPNVASVGPLGGTNPKFGDIVFLQSGCTMYRRSILEKMNYFDTIFDPGYFTDIDLSMRIMEEGYECIMAPANFPVMHLGISSTMDKGKDKPLVDRNLRILEKRHSINGNKFKVSIVIPTYNHCEDLLKPCLESIKSTTDLETTEIIVVANGCTDNTREYVESLGEPFRLIWFDEAIGYTRATNEGLKVAKGEYGIALNNDCIIFPPVQEMIDEYGYNNAWIKILMKPFLEDPKVAITGVLQTWDYYAGCDALIGFCIMAPMKIWKEFGYYDEIYSPGAGEDIHISAQVQEAGYKIKQVPYEGRSGWMHTFLSPTGQCLFPIWHINNKTFGEIPEYSTGFYKINGMLNAKRHNKHLKLNLGSGDLHFHDFLSVDRYNKDWQTQCVMDIQDMGFWNDDSVEEILASHVLEHINPKNTLSTLKEWYRILKSSGKLVIELPYTEELFKTYIDICNGKKIASLDGRIMDTVEAKGAILACVYGCVNTLPDGNIDPATAPHLTGWDPDSLKYILELIGFTNITIGPALLPHPECPSFRVECEKII